MISETGQKTRQRGGWTLFLAQPERNWQFWPNIPMGNALFREWPANFSGRVLVSGEGKFLCCKRRMFDRFVNFCSDQLVIT